MSASRAVSWMMVACAMAACGTGQPDEQPGQGEAVEEREQALHKSVGPQSLEHFPTNWFWDTTAHINNPNPEHVELRLGCRRAGKRWLTVAPGAAMSTHMGCGGTTLEVFNGAPAAPPGTAGYYVHVTTQ